MIGNTQLGRPFTGRTYRILSSSGASWFDYFEFRFAGEPAPVSENIPLGVWDFDNEPKLGPAILYRRPLPSGLNADEYFSGNRSAAIVSSPRVQLDLSAERPMQEDEFWHVIGSFEGDRWPARLEQIVASLSSKSISEILGFHLTLLSKLDELIHPLRVVQIDSGSVEESETEAAIAAIVFRGRHEFVRQLEGPWSLDPVQGLSAADVLDLVPRALAVGHGVNAHLFESTLDQIPVGEAAAIEDEPLGPDAIAREREYRARIYGFNDPVWDAELVADWLSARALVRSGSGIEEIVLLVGCLSSEPREHAIRRILDRLLEEGALVSELEVERPFFGRPGLSAPPIYGISKPKRGTVAEYFAASGLIGPPPVSSAAPGDAHPRWSEMKWE